MQISGNFLPSSSGCTSCPPNQALSEYRQPLPERDLDTQQKNRQQTVEYVFRGEFLDGIGAEEQKRNQYTQSIHPANQSAISSYTDTASVSTQFPDRQGRLVDMFI